LFHPNRAPLLLNTIKYISVFKPASGAGDGRDTPRWPTGGCGRGS
jgi:hypothetical protein